MAKRRNAAALFEVIHTDSRFPKRHESGGGFSLRASRWFRGRGGDTPVAAPVATPVRAEVIDLPPRRPAGPSIFARMGGAISALLPSMPRFGMDVDPEQQTVRFQLSYTAAFVAAFAIVAAIGLAYAAGRQTAQRPRPALAEVSTDDLREGPPNPEVLDIGGDDEAPPLAMASGSVPAVRAGAAGGSSGPSSPTQAPPADTAARPSSWNQPAGPTTLVVSDRRRTVGLTYVIIQSYPSEEKEMAEEAVKLLNDKGVLCTTETGLPYAPRWISVVGITGFDRIRDSKEYDTYIAQILQISEQMAGTSKFKRFDPKPFRWKESRG